VHKTQHAYRDGYKAHVAVEPDTGLVTGCELTAGDAAAAPGLLDSEPAGTEVLGDSAYGTGELRQHLEDREMTAAIKPPPLRPAVEGGYTRLVARSATARPHHWALSRAGAAPIEPTTDLVRWPTVQSFGRGRASRATTRTRPPSPARKPRIRRRTRSLRSLLAGAELSPRRSDPRWWSPGARASGHAWVFTTSVDEVRPSLHAFESAITTRTPASVFDRDAPTCVGIRTHDSDPAPSRVMGGRRSRPRRACTRPWPPTGHRGLRSG
jgi:hypothetical protein